MTQISPLNGSESPVAPEGWLYRIRGLEDWHWFPGPDFTLPDPKAVYEKRALYGAPPVASTVVAHSPFIDGWFTQSHEASPAAGREDVEAADATSLLHSSATVMKPWGPARYRTKSASRAPK